MWKRIHGWQECFLTHAGKKILLKSVIQALPTYTMSVFRLPKMLHREINSIMVRFWWGHMENTHKISWLTWDGMGKSKKCGRIGFRELDSFNVALLAKQGWRLVMNLDSLAARVFKEKYFPASTFLSSTLGRRPPYMWRSIWNARPLLKEGLLWRIGDGASVKIWGDNWIPNSNSHQLIVPIIPTLAESKVQMLIDRDINWWNIPLLEQLFPLQIVENISRIPIAPRSAEDRMIWSSTLSGQFSVRSAYHMEVAQRSIAFASCSNPAMHSLVWKLLWRLDIPRSTQLFLWQACQNILPTKQKLFRRKIVEDPLCLMCGQMEEQVGHVLWSCTAA